MPNKGYKATPEHKRNLSKAKKGKLSPLNKTIFKKGAENVNWNNGSMLNPHRQRDYLRKTRKMALEALGNKCQRCGFDDERALQIDHVNGGGSQERKFKTFQGSFNNNVIRSFMKGEDKYQILCANCNWIKRAENKEINRLA